MRKYLLLFLLCLSLTDITAQICSENDNTLIVKISTDRIGRETSWIVGTVDSIYGSVDKNVYQGVLVDIDTFCIPQNECLTFTIFDGFGDGIIDGGGYELTLNGEILATNGDFGLTESVEINCPEGTSCSKAIPIEEGKQVAPQADSWYVFMPDSIGTYTISTCDANNCDTQIWVYDRCESVQVGDNEGFIFFNDDACGIQAAVNALLDAGRSYLIRISDKGDDCNDQPIPWSLTYNGPIIGCTDPTSCNYNPLATGDDGSCIPQGNPDCPNGPDLSIREDILRSSMKVDIIDNQDDCLINEGCLKGFGRREVIRFTTRFENIGEQDYYIGAPSTESNQFTFDNCHNHFHYDNYAEYLLYNDNGDRLPAGFKSGFCVVDLLCTSGNNKYGCNNMGLTVGCSDEYNSTLDCQWIDVTDYPDGNYTFIARVNWGNQPDLVGRVEKNLTNNWSQACLTLDRSSGNLVATVAETCPIIEDCEGTPYGNVQKDCTGVCGGTTLMGDLDNNTQQDRQDVAQYLSMILEEETPVTPCNDLNGDAALTVYDAALLADCLSFGQAHQHPEQGLHNHCDFPAGILNSLDTVQVKIAAFDDANKTIDLAIKNTSTDIVAFQLQLSGITIQSVENLLDSSNFSPQLQTNIQEAMIVGLATDNSKISQSRAYQSFLRIHYLEITNPIACIKQITDIINGDFQQVITTIEGDCLDVMLTDTKQLAVDRQISIAPNPFNHTALLTFPNPNKEVFTVRILDAAGRLQTYHTGITGNRFEINRQGLSNGLYFIQLVGEQNWMVGKLVVE